MQEQRSMAKNTGIPYEILTQKIFNLILNNNRVKNINMDHDVELQGITAKRLFTSTPIHPLPNLYLLSPLPPSSSGM